MRFETPWALALLALIPVFVVFAVRDARWRRARFAALADEHLRHDLVQGLIPARALWRSVLLIFAFALTVTALARPQFGGRTELSKVRGVDVVIAIDASRSMLAQDIRPDRLSRAKLELLSLLEGLRGNRVGLVVFAGESFVQCPLTTDVGAAQLFLRAVDTESVAQGGTAIAAAITNSVNVLEGAKVSGQRNRVIVLLTDGEDHEGDLDKALSLAKEKGVVVHTVGVGSTVGEPIPMFTEDGRPAGYLRDDAGKTVMSRMNEGLLAEIAQKGGGLFVRSTDLELGLGQIAEAVDAMEKSELESRLRRLYDEQYQLVLFPAFVALLGAMMLRGARVRGAAALLAVMLTNASFTPFTREDPDVKAGNASAAAGDYDGALKHYNEALKRNPMNPRVHYDRGISLYKKGEFEAAREAFLRAVDRTEPTFKADNFFNLGNANLQLGRLEDAIDAYKRALKANAKHQPARRNLEIALRQKREQEKQQKQKEQEGKDGEKSGDEKKEGEKGDEKKDGEKGDEKGDGEKSDGEKGDGEKGDEGEPGKSAQQNPEEKSGGSGDENQEEGGDEGKASPQAKDGEEGDEGASGAGAAGAAGEEGETGEAMAPTRAEGLRVLDALKEREGALKVVPFGRREQVKGRASGKGW